MKWTTSRFTTRLLAATLGLCLLAGSGCGSLLYRGSIARSGERVTPYTPLVVDAMACAYTFPFGIPFVAVDVPLTVACETAILPFWACASLADHIAPTPRDAEARSLRDMPRALDSADAAPVDSETASGG